VKPQKPANVTEDKNKEYLKMESLPDQKNAEEKQIVKQKNDSEKSQNLK